MMKTKELISKLQNIVNNYKTVYMWGVFGAPVTEALIAGKAKQYPEWYTAERQAAFRKLIGKGYFGFDCVNVIKGILWGWSGDASRSYGGATYASNGVPDVSANGMLTKLIGASADFSNIVEGEAVWMDGHIGVYIGGGKVIECTPRWSNNVQVTACLNIGSISGMNGRKWTKHGKLPYVEYEKTAPAISKPADPKETETKAVTETYSVAKGDTLSKIASKFGVTVTDLVAWNSIKNPNVISIGQKLKVSAEVERTYTVASGDSLWMIAAKLLKDGSRYKEIRELNGLKSDTIHAGQVLKIPSK